MPSGARLAALGAVVAAAAGLRLADLDLMEWKGDEAAALHQAQRWVAGGELPRLGLGSSLGIPNPPLFLYAVALPAGLQDDPRFVTAALVGGAHVAAVLGTWLVARRRIGAGAALAAATFFACGTWPVLFGRKLWAQDLLPLAALALLAALLRVHERPRSRWIAAVPLLACALAQLHFSGALLLPATGLALLPVRRALHGRALAAGTGLALLLALPWLSHQVAHGFGDVRALAAVALGGPGGGAARAPLGEPVRQALALGVGTDLAASLGGDAALHRARLGAAGSQLAAAATAVGTLLLGAGLMLALRDARRDALARVSLLLGLGYLALFTLLRPERVHAHYFLVLLPLPFLWMALPLRALFRRAGRGGALAATALVLVFAAGHAANLLALRGLLRQRGGAAGDYGVAYAHKAALADWVVERGLELRDPPGFEYRYLVGARRRAAGREARRGGDVLVREIFDPGARRAGSCPGRAEFGPLVACVR